MREPRYCPIESATTAAFDAADHEDLAGDEYENIEVYDCPACGGTHRYHNGRFTLAPMTIQCALTGCDEPAAPDYTWGLRGYCSREHELTSERRAAALMEGRDPADVEGLEPGALDDAPDWDPESMQQRIDELAGDSG